MLDQFSRTQLLFGKEGMERLHAARVAVFGVGGVGGYTVEALARSGVGALDLIDDDRVCITNINRQILATRETVGQYKVDAAMERVRSINPKAQVNGHKTFFAPETAGTFDFTQFKKLWMNVRADVGATTYFSEIAMIQTLDNLRHDGVLDVMAYLERIPDKLIPRKRELMARLKESAALEQAQSGVAASALGGTLDSGQALGLMSGRVQQAFANAPRTAKKALVQRAQNMQKM